MVRKLLRVFSGNCMWFILMFKCIVFVGVTPTWMLGMFYLEDDHCNLSHLSVVLMLGLISTESHGKQVCLCVCPFAYVDPQEGVVVLLSAESQQRLVQLLYFLPKMPQPLLANLSCCCTAGRISAGLAASLIRIVRLRWARKPTYTWKSHNLNLCM